MHLCQRCCSEIGGAPLRKWVWLQFVLQTLKFITGDKNPHGLSESTYDRQTLRGQILSFVHQQDGESARHPFADDFHLEESRGYRTNTVKVAVLRHVKAELLHQSAPASYPPQSAAVQRRAFVAAAEPLDLP